MSTSSPQEPDDAAPQSNVPRPPDPGADGPDPTGDPVDPAIATSTPDPGQTGRDQR